MSRAVQRVRAFAKMTPHGLAKASRLDVVAFAQQRASARALTLSQFLRTASWRLTATTVKMFYAWAIPNGLCRTAESPMHGIILPASPPSSTRLLGPRDGCLYEKVLHTQGVPRPDRAMLFLLAHGLTPADVCTVRLEDLDLASGHVTVRTARACWRVPLSDAAVAVLRDFVSASPRLIGWLFPRRDGRRATSDAAVRFAVRRAAARAFPHPLQASKRRRVRPIGFRHLFLRRFLNTRIAPVLIADLTRFVHFDSVRRYVDARRPLDARRELVRVARHWTTS